MSKFSVKEKFAQLSGFVTSVFASAKAKIQQVVNKKPAVKTAEEILQTTRTEATPPSKLPDEPVTATPTITSEISSGETFSQSLDVVEAAPTLPPVIDKQQIISPQEPEIVVEITQTQVIVAIKETGEEALPEQIPLNKPVED